MTFGLGQRSGNSSAPNTAYTADSTQGGASQWVHVPWENCASPSPPSHEEGVALLVAHTCNEVVFGHKEFLRGRQSPVPLICIVCWVLACTVPGARVMLHLERDARDWCTYNEYSYRIILVLLLYVYCSRAHPHIPSRFRRRRLQDFVYLQRKHTKNLGGQFTFFSGRQVNFQKRIFANTTRDQLFLGA